MDSRIILLLMSLTTFIAYPFLSASDRKQVLPLATKMDEPEDEELDDEDEPVTMEDDEDEVSDLQIDEETKNIREKASDQKIVGENKGIKEKALDPQLSKEEDEEDFN
jgi:hypothetical protein